MAMPRTLSRFLLCYLLWFACPVLAEETANDRARALFDAREWAQAADAYRDLLAEAPENGPGWWRLGYALRELGDYDASIDAYERALAVGFDGRQVTTGLAIALAMAGQSDRAFEYLAVAIDDGLAVDVLDSHPGLASLRADPRFAELRAAAEIQSYPCEHGEIYRALDFWVGEWDVYVGDERAGTNRIEKIMRGCIVLESWQSVNGDRGQSINYYDPQAKQWKQNWVDEHGGVVRYAGGVREGGMHMTGVNVAADGGSELARVTLTPRPDGTVHHLIEHSSDDGRTWQNWFDATYRPAKTESPVP